MNKDNKDQNSNMGKNKPLQGDTEILESKEGVSVQEDGFRYGYDDSSNVNKLE